MNLYLITRPDHDYDEYDGFVVAANTAKEARTLLEEKYNPEKKYGYSSWPDDFKKTAKLIGTTDKYTKPTEILGSFNSG